MKIFISYRRDDTQAVAGRMYDELKRQFGIASVYLDFEGNKVGIDFRSSLEAALGACDVVVAVVGGSWLGVKEGRLRSDEDYVRQEIEAALRKNVRIIPVFVDGAKMPPPEAMPTSVREFVYRQGVDLSSGKRFETDMLEVLRVLDIAEKEMFPSIWHRLRRLMRRRPIVSSMAIIGPVAVAASVAAVTLDWIPDRLVSPNANVGGLSVNSSPQSSSLPAPVRPDVDSGRSRQTTSMGELATPAAPRPPQPRSTTIATPAPAGAPSFWAYYEVNKTFSASPSEGSVIVIASPRLSFLKIRSGSVLRADTDVNLYGQPPAPDETSLTAAAIKEVLSKGACLRVLEDASPNYDKTKYAWIVSGIESSGFLKVRKTACP